MLGPLVGALWILTTQYKIALCMDMTEACFRTCAAGIWAQNPGITGEELPRKTLEGMIDSNAQSKEEIVMGFEQNIIYQDSIFKSFILLK